MDSKLHPLIKWAQRKDKIFLEIGLRDIEEERVNITEKTVKFEGKSNKKDYAFEIELFESIKTEESKWYKTGFHLLMALQKKDCNQPFWKRLVTSTEKNQYIQIDWQKWVDEDEEDQEGTKGLDGFDPSQMQGFPGMGGGNMMDEDDEDDEEGGNIEDLDKPEEVE